MATYQIKTAVPEFSGTYALAACPEGYFTDFSISPLDHVDNTNRVVAHRLDRYYIKRPAAAGPEKPIAVDSALELAIRQWSLVLFVFQSTTDPQRTITIATRYQLPESILPDEPLEITGMYFNSPNDTWIVKHFTSCCPSLHHPSHGEVFAGQEVILFAI